MTKIRIAYSRQPREGFDNTDPSGTSHMKYDNSETFDETLDLKYQLFELEDTKYAKIFLEQWHNAQNENNARRLQYNIYEKISVETLLESQQQMLDTISAINTGWPEWSVPDDIVIEINSDDQQLSKLNALHEYFEDVSNSNNKVDGHRDKELYFLLERINYLVHKMEGGAIKREEDLSRHTVIRSAGRYNDERQGWYRLQDEDYKNFEVTRPGYLYVDFATVGKDFFNCVFTNDTELVRNKKVSPQLYIRPCMSFRASNQTLLSDSDYEIQQQSQRNRAIKWLEDNNLSDIDSVDIPNRANGRLRLATPVEDVNYKTATEIVSTHPYIYGVYIEED